MLMAYGKMTNNNSKMSFVENNHVGCLQVQTILNI